MSGQKQLEKLKNAVNSMESLLGSHAMSFDHMRKMIEADETKIDSQNSQIEKLQKENAEMKQQIESLLKIDQNDSDAKKVLVKTLQESQMNKDCLESTHDELDAALTTSDEMTNAFVTFYAGLTKIVENDVTDQKDKDKIRDSQLKLIETVCNKVEQEHCGYHADTLATLLTQEKRRIKLNKRKFKQKYLLSLRHYHD